MKLPDLPAGVWRHYRGPLYLVLGYASDSTNSRQPTGRIMVAYVGLELTSTARPGPRLLVRDADEFRSRVDPATGEGIDPDDPRNAAYPLRFTYLGPCWDGPAAKG